MVFCDWLSIYQEHLAKLPIINDGAVFGVDENGQVQWTTLAKAKIEGSYDTTVWLKCDGSRVTLEGNIGRFRRPDNVFGYSVIQCIQIANTLLAKYQLPPFTEPRFDSYAGLLRDGAVITRVDLTCNYETGSLKNARKIIAYLGGQDSGRRAHAHTYGEGGVTWNEGSQYWYAKVYLKSLSLGNLATDQIKQYTTDTGLLRHEISLKSRYLKQNNLQFINQWHTDKYGKEVTDMENVIYNRFTDILNRGQACETPLEAIPKNLGNLALAWRAGKDIWNDESYGKSTRRRYRKQLLAYGIDIKQPSNITTLNMRVNVLEMTQASVPSWYWNQKVA
jgi:hypothetical protein